MGLQAGVRRRLAQVMRRIGLPGARLVAGQYMRHNVATIFPRAHASLLQAATDVEFHGAFFNLEDDVSAKEGVVLGHHVVFLTGRHDMGPEGVDHRSASSGAIRVRHGAWIAPRATVLGGLEIGEASLIGAGSFVTRSVPSHEFWAGNPLGSCADSTRGAKQNSTLRSRSPAGGLPCPNVWNLPTRTGRAQRSDTAGV